MVVLSLASKRSFLHLWSAVLSSLHAFGDLRWPHQNEHGSLPFPIEAPSPRTLRAYATSAVPGVLGVRQPSVPKSWDASHLHGANLGNWQKAHLKLTTRRAEKTS